MLDYRKSIGIIAGLVLVVATLVAGLARPGFAAPTYGAPIFDPAGKQVGTATFTPVSGGTEIIVHVSGLPPGNHGFHIHEVGSCNPLRDTTGKVTAFGAAGGHFDPASTGHHMGPDGNGHAGDLPMLAIDRGGMGGLTYFDPRVQLTGANTIVGRSIVIHANADNYTDTPPNGGSGDRIACGEIGALQVH